MRAVFTFDLPEVDGQFAESDALSNMLSKMGWSFENVSRMTPSDIEAIMQAQIVDRLSHNELNGNKQTIDSRSQADISERYSLPDLCAPLFKEMPEVAAAEKNAIIFLGYIANYQTIFVVTRMVGRQVTFRLLHRQLIKLQSSTVLMMNMLLSTFISDSSSLILSSSTVSVYERQQDHVIITGRVITNPVSETINTNFKDFVLVVGPLLILLPTTASLFYTDSQNAFVYGFLERLSTALITTILVSILGIYTSWREIKKNKLIDWSVDTPGVQRFS